MLAIKRDAAVAGTGFPAHADMMRDGTSLNRHSRESGNPFVLYRRKWIPASAGMTCAGVARRPRSHRRRYLRPSSWLVK